MNGIPVPYLPANDSFVMVLLIVCFSIIAFSFIQNGSYLLSQMKGLLFKSGKNTYSRERTKTDFVSQSMLLLQTLFLCGIVQFVYMQNHVQISVHSSVFPVLLYSALFLGFLLMKALLYGIVNPVFFDKAKRKEWNSCYFMTIEASGGILFFIVILLLYLHIDPFLHVLILLSLYVLAKAILIKRCFQIFFVKKDGLLGFILYFCALEIVPLFLLWRGMIETNYLLTINS